MQKITGTKDILPEEILKYRYIENTSRKIFEVYGYKEIRTPIFEATEVFSKSIGETTDIVEKEMYSFKDKANRSLTLRPEGTASIVRAYIENGFFKSSPFIKLFYIGPMFRAEKPQKGRYREFNQIGVEAIGSPNPAVDAEIIEMLVSLFNELKLSDLNIMINSVGCFECRKKYKDEFLLFIKDKRSLFCDNCKTRADKNAMRILDCKNEKCMDNLKPAPSILDYLCNDCKTHFDKVRKLLSDYSVKYEINKNLVRGLDYYTKTVFEVTSGNLGAQNAIAAGGRYDNLIKDFEGPDTPAIGFAIGIERLLDMIEEKKAYLPETQRIDVFFATLGEDAFQKALLLIKELRKNKVSCEIDYSIEKSLKSQMRKSNQLNARFTVIIGDDELKKGVCTIKDMDKSIQEEVKIETDTLLRRINQR
jgi:histidyl-tRNA synthetase